MQTVLVTGGAGFIGSAVVRHLVRKGKRVVNLDLLTYAGNPASLKAIENAPNHRFVQGDIADVALILSLLREEQVDGIMHLAAESHVDRSIDGPAAFVETNVVGTFRILSAALEYWRGLEGAKKDGFRFHHISTDEVFGDLPFDSGIFTEDTPYAPSSPYSASKAASDHLVRAWQRTYGLPTVITNCTNNYGPWQNGEKLIPTVIRKAILGAPIPIYGDGKNVRDWLYVEDHARGLIDACAAEAGSTLLFGARAERSNLDLVKTICALLDELKPKAGAYANQIEFVTDRKGHDRRYAIDPSSAERAIGWSPQRNFDQGLTETVEWYLTHLGNDIADKDDRLGLARA